MNILKYLGEEDCYKDLSGEYFYPKELFCPCCGEDINEKDTSVDYVEYECNKCESELELGITDRYDPNNGYKHYYTYQIMVLEDLAQVWRQAALRDEQIKSILE